MEPLSNDDPLLRSSRLANRASAPVDDMPALTPDEYRSLMRYWPSGVSVVAAAVDGVAEGCTVSAFTSVGIDPPTVLVCLGERSRTLAAVLAAGRFSVSVLGADQVALAERFSAPATTNRFRDTPHRMLHDAPVPDDVLLWFVCDVGETISASAHTIVLGEPIAGAHERMPHDPLVFVDRSWRQGFAASLPLRLPPT